MEIPHASLIFALSAVDNVLTQTMTTHNIRLSEMTAIACLDSPGWRDSCGVGSSRLPLPRGSTERRMWPTPPTGLWESVQTAWQVIVLSLLILKKHFFFFLWRWTIINFCPPSFLPIVQYVKRPLHRIGLFLDSDNGAVSFWCFQRIPHI